MNFEKIKNKFHWSWWSKIQKFIESEKCDLIYAFLKERSSEGVSIAPSSFNLYKCFKDLDLRELKVVIIGENPYSKFILNEPIDNGVLFDSTTTAQPTLLDFYAGIEKELYDGLNLSVVFDDLEYLIHQGVLMLPSSLTIEKDSEKGHNKLWKPFMEFLLKEIIGPTGVPILFLGRSSQYLPLVEKTNYCYTLPLPSFGSTWDTKNTFTKINQNIWDTNKETIMWLNIITPF